MTTGTTIYRRDGSVAFVAERATTMREAVEQAAKSGADLTDANLYDANLDGANLQGADLAHANLQGATGVHYATTGPVDGWMVALTLTSEGLRISAGCRYFTVPEAREHWGDPLRWTAGTSPEHGARMLHAVNALLALAADWPVQLPEASR